METCVHLINSVRSTLHAPVLYITNHLEYGVYVFKENIPQY